MLVKAIVIAAFALMTLLIGVVGLRRTRSFSDFFLGGGKVGPWMTAFTYGTAYFSAVLFIGFAGKVGWGFGYSGLWIAVGNSLLGVLAVWWLLGARIKAMSVQYQVATMPEFLEKRYNSRFLKLFSSASIFVFFIPYSAAVFIGLSYLFQSNFNVGYPIALLFMGLFTALYLVMGGYKSMTIIDVTFGMIMIVGVLILLWSTVDKAGGLAGITAGLSSIDPKLTRAVGPPGLWPLFSLVFLTSVAPFAMPQLVQKFYAIKDKRSIRIGMVASTVFAVLITGIGYFTGATTRFFLSPEVTPKAFADGKPIFDVLMPELLANVIPQSLSVLILLLILAASMSTLAALVLVSSSSVAKDLYAGFINTQVSDRRLTALMRILSAFFVLLSVVLAYFRPSTIVTILGISWGAIGSVFLGPFIWGLFSKRVNAFGAISSSVLGLAACLITYLQGTPSPQAGTIGMIVSLVVNPVFSLFRPAPAAGGVPDRGGDSIS
ncbi:MAG TPA: sodium:solute symporter [Acidobacteriota bacterium]|nr:sodium:solute symporter [Acidobacteriota bacterium]